MEKLTALSNLAPFDGTIPGDHFPGFSGLVQRLIELVAAERDIVDLVAGDVACDHWIREAETARAAVVSAAEAVILAMSPTATDRRFRIVARNLEAMLLTQDAGKYHCIAKAMLTSAWIYNVPGRGLRAARATVLLQAFRRSFGELLSLPDYAPEPLCAPAMAMTMPMAA